MRKNIYRFLMALVIALTSIAFTSCGPDELPEVIASEVFGQGMEETITETPESELEGAEIAAELSYKSWILVKGETRGSFEEKVEVTLTNVFNNTETMVEVDDFNLGEYTTSLSSKIRKTREEGFVDIVDTVLIYTVDFEDFSYDFEIEYEVATYDDGVTKQLMPYHRLGTIRDKGYNVEYLEWAIDDETGAEFVYVYQLLTHTITVEFCGKTYDLVAQVKLRKYVGQHPCVVKSEPISSKITFVIDYIESEFVVRRTWSDGRVESEPAICYLGAYIDCENFEYKVIKNYKNDLAIVSSNFGDVVSEPRATVANFVTATRNYKDWCVNYNYFSIAINFVYDEAWYDDGILKCQMPGSCEFTEIVNAPTIMDCVHTGEDEEGKYAAYQFKQDVSAKYGELSLSGWGAMEVVAYE